MVHPHNQSLMELVKDKGTVSESEKIEKDQLEWTPDLEVSLFYSMVGHKPVGPNRFFQMYFAHQNFCSLICKDVDVSVIWKKLETMYDLATLDESESVTTKGELFSLLRSFKGLMEKAKLGLGGSELLTQDNEKRSEKNKDVNNKPDDATNIKEEPDAKNDMALSKDLQKPEIKAKLDIVSKPTPGKRENKDIKKGNLKEKDKKDLKKDVHEAKSETIKDGSSKKDSKELTKEDEKDIKKNEKVKKDLKENKKVLKKDSPDKKLSELSKKEIESKKIESLKKLDTKLETSKQTRVESLKRESLSEKRRESIDKKADGKTIDKKSENNKNIDKKNDTNKSTDKKNDNGKSDIKMSDKKMEPNKSTERKNNFNKNIDKKVEKKTDKKLEKSTNSNKTPEVGNSSTKFSDLSSKSTGKTPDLPRKKEKKEVEGDKPDKESFSLKRLRESWPSDETPVKRPKGRPTRNSGESFVKPSLPSNNIIPGKRRRFL